MPLLNSAFNMFLGSTPVDAIFVGTDLVWPPAQGSQPVVSNVSTLRTLTVSWAATPNAETYELRRNGTLILTTASLSHNESGLAWNTNYTYTITPIVFGVPGEESAPSVTIKIATPVGTKPTVSNVATAGTATVSWAAVANASSYQIRRNGSLITTHTGTSYLDSGLAWNTSYSYTVTPIVGGQTGSAGPASTAFSIATPVGAKPVASNASSAGTMSVSWAATTGATSYQIRRNGTYLGTVTSRLYSDSGLNWGVSYSYTITPVVGTRVGAASAASTAVAIPIPSVAYLSASNKSYTNVTVSWPAPLGATEYHVYINGAHQVTTSATSLNIAVGADTTTSVLVHPRRNGYGGYNSRTYYYYSGRAEQRDIGSKTGMVFSPSKIDSWRPVDDWAWLSGKAAQGYYTAAYGNYKGVIYYGSSGVKGSLESTLGSAARRSNGSCTKAELYLYKLSGVGTSGTVETVIRRTNNTASGSEPTGTGPVTKTTAKGGEGSWLNIGTEHGQALGDGTYKSLMVRNDGSADYAHFTDCRLRLSWSWNYVTVTAQANNWWT